MEKRIDTSAINSENCMDLTYGDPINLPQNICASGKTKQTMSKLSIQNLSGMFTLTVFVNRVPPKQDNSITIAAGDRTPRTIEYNWNGAILKVTNTSQESATANIGLIG
jgi:hypothetical protein